MIYAGMVQEKDGKAPIKHYWIDCPKHGRQRTYPQGYYMILHCPKCIEEGTR
jgi:hypothetical protein